MEITIEPADRQFEPGDLKKLRDIMYKAKAKEVADGYLIANTITIMPSRHEIRISLSEQTSHFKPILTDILTQLPCGKTKKDGREVVSGKLLG